MALPPLLARPAWRRRLLFLGLGLLAGWLAFFDSHSLLRRATYAHRLHELQEENERLRAENAALQERLAAGLDPTTVERVAREQYGMRRPGETVYRVTTGEDAD
jgi:cell division protein FtsB